MRDNLTQKDHVDADIVGDRREIGGLHGKRDGGNGAIAGGRLDAIDGEIIGIGSGSAVAEYDQLTALCHALVNGARSFDHQLRLFSRHARTELRVLVSFHTNGIGDLIHDPLHRLLLIAEKRIEESGIAYVGAEFAMLEEDMYRLPERVI